MTTSNLKLKTHKAVYLRETGIYLKTIAYCDGRVHLGKITSRNEDVTCRKCIKRMSKSISTSEETLFQKLTSKIFDSFVRNK